MDNDCWSRFMSPNEVGQQGIYGLLQKLSENYANQLSPLEATKKSMLSMCYMILLKKSTEIQEGLDKNWDDEDIINAIALQISKRCALKETWTNDTRTKVSTYFEVLSKYKESEFFEKCISPTLRFLLCVEQFQKKVPKKHKETNKFFDTEIISRFFNNRKSYLPKQDMKFFSFPQPCRITRSQSERSTFSFNFSAISKAETISFDNIFGLQEIPPNDLDEGFVTPNAEHVEKSPCYGQKNTILCRQPSLNYLLWDYSLMSVPSSKHKVWEIYKTVSVRHKENSFINKDAPLQGWLKTAPPGVTQITREEFLDCMQVLLIGIPSSIFISQGGGFYLKNGVYTNDLTADAVVAMSEKYIDAATAFNALQIRCLRSVDDDVITSTFKYSLNQYLYKYQVFLNFAPKEKGYGKFTTFIEPIIKQIIYLKENLIHEIELKGASLLKHMFDLICRTSNSEILYILSSLFLLPCDHYFRVIDDWIFLGIWHKDLLLKPCDMSFVKDRESWVQAYKPVPAETPWFLSLKDLACCGKGISLLSIANKNEKLLNTIKSGNRPRVKVCLDLDELEVLKEECKEYYENAKQTFCILKGQTEDHVLFSNNNQVIAEAIESSKRKEQMEKIERKRQELYLRENDLKRSAHTRAIKREEDIAADKKAAAEHELILLKEKQQEIENAKLVYKRYRIIMDEEEKQMRRDQWFSKRHALDEKRNKYLMSNLNLTQPVPSKSVDNSIASLEREDKEDNMAHRLLAENNVTKETTIKDSDNRNFEENPIFEEEVEKQLSLIIDIDNENISGNEEVLLNLENKNVSQEPVHDRKELDPINFFEKEIELSDLERNRMKILGSDLGRGVVIKKHIWSDEMERNKKNMLESHLQLGSIVENKETDSRDKESITYNLLESLSNQTQKEELTKTIIEEHIAQTSREFESTCGTKETHTAESNKIALESQMYEVSSEKDDKSVISVDCLKSTKKWFQGNHLPDKMNHIFFGNDPILIPNKNIDFACFPHVISNSLKAVLSIQVKLVNEAVMKMFLENFQLLKLAQKLREYFFLHGQFGKHLTSSLSTAIENEEPSTLLTFYRLRSILAKASGEDIKELSFVVTETPVAFVHTNSQVLSCLGLTYKFEWPLNLIFTDKAISKYNDIFEYMSSLQRVSWHLEQVWRILDFKPVLVTGYQYSQVQLYRFIMSQFVCTLLSYIVTVVIEGCWQDFIKDVSKVNDIDELYHRHAAYIKSIISKCFLDQRAKQLMAEIHKLLHYILVFCRILRFGEWNISATNVYTHSNFDKLKTSFTSFLLHAQTITKSIKKLVDRTYQADIEYLYFALTINNFYHL